MSINEFLKENYLFIIFSVSFLVQIFYFLFFYFRIFFVKTEQKKVDIPVSVVITARNEAENLRKFLPLILEQNYPDFEVIVVNDASEDESEIILAGLKQKYPNLYFTNIPKDDYFSHGKKLALTLGIKAAKNEIILLTDADCRPVSRNWISQMVANFDENTDFVIGYGGYEKTKGLTDKFIRSDTVFIALNYFTYALAGLPYMGVGRNMAIRKSFFFKIKGFSKDYQVLSGSDDLLINKHANKKNLKTELHKDSFIRSVQKRNLKKWFEQKTRHLTTAEYYKFKYKFLLQTEMFSRLIFQILTVILLIFNQLIYFVIGIFIFRLLMLNLIFIKANKTFEEKGLLLFENFYDFLQIPFNFVCFVSNLFNRKKNKLWK